MTEEEKENIKAKIAEYLSNPETASKLSEALKKFEEEINRQRIIALKQWINSVEGKVAMQKAAERAAKIAKEIEQLCYVSDSELRKKVNI